MSAYLLYLNFQNESDEENVKKDVLSEAPNLQTMPLSKIDHLSKCWKQHWYGNLLVFPHTHSPKSFFQFQGKSFFSIRKLSASLSFSESHDYSSSAIYSHISFWCNQMGSAFFRMNSSTSIPSMVAGRLTRFCFPLMKMVMYSFYQRFFSLFSAAVSLRLRFAVIDAALLSLSL